ncbi:DUF3592 domain-containing protein [Echinicola soli]|uniref:DUF3592 domain-containing protein n=1 Tax=Echinicola soli TaxID=2591634 RepID=A0A514CIH2_9BACT|nr:DUF3592 domain-containing protein [Echinicola soli]QDH79612.1 DUF3592 domain-containing protein [Echinicola soli]
MGTIKIISVVFATIGMALLVVAFMSYQSTNDWLDEAMKTDGTVIAFQSSYSDGTTLYRPVIQFEDKGGNNVIFHSSTASSPPAYSKGENVTVLYPESNPNEAKIEGFFSLWGMVVIVGGIGMVFFLVGGGIIFSVKRKSNTDKWLRRNGNSIDTAFQGVILDTSLTVNGRHPFRILSQWQDPTTSEVHVFKSNSLWFDPSQFIDQKNIKVFIGWDNPKKYYMDVSFLPKYGG